MKCSSTFERFIRSGGHAAIVIPLGGDAAPEVKAGPEPELPVRSLTGQVNADNIAWLTQFLGQEARTAIARVPVHDLELRAQDDLRRRLAATGGAGPGDDPVLAGLLHRFEARLNAQRQQALGISHYVWRSQDDDRVRATHAAWDDQVFSWDDPPPDGFPGEAFGCRCYAEPVIAGDVCAPKTGLALGAAVETAALAGYAEAAVDFGLDLLGGLVDLAQLAVGTVDFGISELAVLLGIAGDARQAEVARVHARIAHEVEHYDARLQQLADALAGLPDLAQAFLGYVDAVSRHATDMREAYLRCEVSETELREAVREDAYLRASIAIAAVPAIGTVGAVAGRARRLLTVLGDDAGGLGDAAALRRLTDRILVPGLPRGFRQTGRGDVDWGAGSHKDRGLSYERSLAERADGEGRGTWLEKEFRDHPGVDFFDFATGQATSVKTLDLNAYTYRTSPSQIYGTLSRYVRDLAEFEGGEGLIRREEVRLRTSVTGASQSSGFAHNN
ncbi:minor capsid protein [Celeribacter indicus]|uniref:Phage head morphogenesis domain-containing protein n=1 Tax=Celeribacter indicus TaxID=1208324 RepID=A0A0B5E0T0_9RHOB|nr:minor capsid protein [Celeribacter indicus]AJE46067.1 phage head morphogenesis domain-containing protein [Celeribacter indicus]SDX34102.1 phage putative head morphogenesis protein, SPP1 gp7 family [Celeribacter indicus]